MNIDNKPKDSFHSIDTLGHSETISYQIIQLLISQTITKSNGNNVMRKEGDFCYDYFCRFLQPMIKLSYFQFDDNISNMTLNALCQDIEEPTKPSFDRDAFTLIRYEKIIQNDDQINESAEKTHLILKKTSMQDESYPNWHYPMNGNNNNNNSLNSTLLRLNSNRNIKVEAIKLHKSNAVNQAIDLQSSDITNMNNFSNYDPESIEQLRSEVTIKNNQRLNREEEEKKGRDDKLIRNPKQSVAEVKHFELDMNKFTIDGDGRIIPCNHISQDKLKDGFIIPNAYFRLIENNDNQDNELSKDGTATHSRFKYVNSNSVNALIKTKKTTTSIQDISTAANSNNSKRYFKVSSSLAIPIQENQPMIFSKNDEPIVVSGNNFDLFKPETGVIVQNIINGRDIKKIGNMDFYRKYNKYSLIEYERLNEMFRSKSIMKNRSCGDFSFNQLQMTKEKKCIDKEDENNGNDYSKFNNKHKGKDDQTMLRSRNKRKKTFPKSLSMVKIMINRSSQAIKMAFDSLEPLPEIEQYSKVNDKSSSVYNSSLSMFSKAKMSLMHNSIDRNKNDINYFEQMNKFSSTIMAKLSHGWGNPSNVYNNNAEKSGLILRKPVKKKENDAIMKKTLRNKFLLKPLQPLQSNNINKSNPDANVISPQRKAKKGNALK